MKQEYREAFEEVHEIFKLMPKELLNKIPIKFQELIEEERDKEYFPNIKEPLEQQELKNETIIILGLIYRDFLCPLEEKKKLQEKDEKELKSLEKEIRQKYDPDDIFKQKDKIIEKQTQPCKENKMIALQEERWYKRIYYIIRNIFKRNG